MGSTHHNVDPEFGPSNRIHLSEEEYQDLNKNLNETEKSEANQPIQKAKGG